MLYDRAVTRWRDAALHKALAEIQPTPCASTGKGGQTGPSAPLIAALRHLSDSLQRWAYFDDEENRSTLAKGLLEEFVARIHPQGSKPERLVAMWDLCFLRTICVEWDGALTSSVKLLDTLIEQVRSGYHERVHAKLIYAIDSSQTQVPLFNNVLTYTFKIFVSSSFLSFRR